MAARRQQAIRRLSSILCTRDRERQATGDFTNAHRDAALAMLLLSERARRQLSDKQCAGLALVVHHGGSVHDLRLAKHALVGRVITVDQILLYRQICDRIQIMRGRPQIFGTQLKVNKATGETKLFPIRPRL